MRTVEHQRGSGPRWAAVLAGLVLLALLAGACGGESADPSPTTTSVAATSEPSPTTTSTASTTTTKVLTDEEAVRATIDQYWVEWTAAFSPPDPERAGLATVMEGDALTKVKDQLQKRLALGQSSKRSDGTTVHPETYRVLIDSDIALVRQCVVDDMVVTDVATGEVVDGSVHSLVLDTSLRRNGKGWFVFTSTAIKDREGTSQCFAE